jgi:hypothetical protein
MKAVVLITLKNVWMAILWVSQRLLVYIDDRALDHKVDDTCRVVQVLPHEPHFAVSYWAKPNLGSKRILIGSSVKDIRRDTSIFGIAIKKDVIVDAEKTLVEVLGQVLKVLYLSCHQLVYWSVADQSIFLGTKAIQTVLEYQQWFHF